MIFSDEFVTEVMSAIDEEHIPIQYISVILRAISDSLEKRGFTDGI